MICRDDWITSKQPFKRAMEARVQANELACKISTIVIRGVMYSIPTLIVQGDLTFWGFFLIAVIGD